MESALTAAIETMIATYRAGHKLVTAGSGGSAADAEHITGELLKSFRCKRPLDAAFRADYVTKFGEDAVLDKLEGSLPAINLGVNFPIFTAILNDTGAEVVFAQQALSLVNPGDVFLAISTSGNSQMLIAAAKVAKVRGAQVVLLSGESGGQLRDWADIALLAPSNETYRIQEMHIMLYHLFCAAVEKEFFVGDY
jgi:D-sedoheptulose 7-phosphate isomerase